MTGTPDEAARSAELAQNPPATLAPDNTDNDFAAFKSAMTAAAPAADGQLLDADRSDDDLDDAELDAIANGEKPAPAAKVEQKPGDKPAEKAAELDPNSEEGKAAAAAAAADGGANTVKVDQELEDQIARLGLKGAAEERFRQLSERVRVRDEELAGVREEAEWARTVRHEMDVAQATPDQFGRAMAVTFAINSNDPKLLQQAYDALSEERDLIAKRIGLRTDSVDPLEGHPDLIERTRSGDLSVKDAEEMARLRASDQLLRTGRERDTQRTTQQVQMEQERAQAVHQAAAWSSDTQARDGAIFQQIAKSQDFLNECAWIQKNRPPAEWAGEVDRVYTLLKRQVAAAPARAPAAPAAPARTGRVPGTATGVAGGGVDRRAQVQDITDPMDAMRAAMAQTLEQQRAGNR